MKVKQRMNKVLSCSLAVTMAFGIIAGTSDPAKAASAVDFPDVYPADKIETIGDAVIKVKVDALIKTMTQDEMYGLLTFSPSSSNGKGYGTGYINGVPRLGVPVIRAWDGPKGVISNNDLETTSPTSELGLASSFSEDLAYKYGVLSGSDNKATAGNMQLGVQLDNARSPFFTRTRDSLGEDPYLTGVLGSKLSAGVESQHVMSTLKHLAAYTAMFHHPILANYVPMPPQDDSVIDEQTLHELYLAPYAKIVQDGHASAIMSSYNKINGVAAAANPYLLKDVLREMWGYKGLTVTDWASGDDIKDVFIHQGTDIEAASYINTKANIQAAITAGKMTWDDVVTAVRHTLTAMGKVGYLGLVVVNADGTAAADPTPPASIELPVLDGAARTALLEANDAIALESAIKGAVLLKNNGNALPVSGADSIAMIGLTGQYTLTGHYAESSFGWLRSMTSPYENLAKLVGKDKITSAVGLDIVGQKIPNENLFIQDVTQSVYGSSANGVTYAVYGGDTRVIPNLELTTGTVNGEVNRTYKNSSDGTALTKGTTVTLSTYLKAPETGTYEFNMQGIGGSIDAKITVIGTDKTIPFKAAGATGVQDGNSAWATGNVIATAEGMNVSTKNLSVDLVQGNTYKMVIKATATSDSKDEQLRLTWFKPGQRAADLAAAISAAQNNKKVIVFVHDLGKGDKPAGSILPLQRSTLALESAQLSMLNNVISAAKSKGNQVIVVTNTALPITMDWIDNVDAVLNMWLPGQQGGKATAQLLAGVANPSGKLPMTYPKTNNDTQFGAIANSYSVPTAVNTFSEGIHEGYRWYDHAGITPLFAFGHGLSYTTFVYSNPVVTRAAGTDLGYDVTFTITNTGSVKGSEVAQVYLGEVAVPSGIQMAKKQLAGFARVEDLQPGESRTVTVKIDRQSLSYWDKDAALQTRADGTKDKYVIAAGTRDILVGTASDDIRLTRTINVQDNTNSDGDNSSGGTDGTTSGNGTSSSNGTSGSGANSGNVGSGSSTGGVTTGSNNGTSSGAVEPAKGTSSSDNQPAGKIDLSAAFTDATSIPGWAENAIAELMNKNIIAGRPNGTFDPQGEVTRAEFVKLVVTGLGLKETSGAKSFADVQDSAWYKTFVDIATSKGVVNGVSDTSFAPDSNVSRQDLCVMIYNALKAVNAELRPADQAVFGDDDKMAGYAKEAVYTLKALSVVTGRGNDSFDPAASATRAEAAVIIKRVLDVISKK